MVAWLNKVSIKTYVGMAATALAIAGCGQPEEAGEPAAGEVVQSAGITATEADAITERPVDLVDPYIDSANSRWFFFNSASRPFGLVNLSPDTDIDGAWNAGYRYDSDEVKVFSHIHAWQLSGGAIMPTASEAPVLELKDDYASPFSHDTETVRPGYHKLTLDRDGIVAELTSTMRVGYHRYQFPDGVLRRFVLPLGGMLGPSEILEGRVSLVNETTLSGMIVNGATLRRPKDTPVFFRIEFNAPVTELSGWNGDEALTDMPAIEGNGGAVVTLAEGENPVIVKFAISYVSEEGAANNMQAEASSWDFDAIAQDADAEWNEMLSRIKVEGGSRQDQVRFYSDLWHALQGRRVISDADGTYADMTGAERRIGQLPMDEDGKPLHAHYNSDSFWGAQWTIQSLWPLAYPEIASGMASSLLQYYQDGGLVPRGPSGGNYTYVMTGASSTPFIVSMYMKGLLQQDPEMAYQAVRKNHMPGGIMEKAGYEHETSTGGGLADYIEMGYAPFPVRIDSKGFHEDGAGQTLEYAYQDWTLAEFAEALGKSDDADYFRQRSGNWENLYDPETGYIRPRNVDGEWKADFDPRGYQQGHVESNAAQMTWFVPQDVDGLAEAMGGTDRFIERLNAAFEEASELGFTAGKGHADENRVRNRSIPINYGNQPSMQTAFLFHQAGAPWLTQYWKREVINAVYREVSPRDGYNGDEDQGLMGALAVLMKIGLFQMTGGTEPEAVYQISTPLFERIEIKLDDTYYPGSSFVIEAPGVSDSNRYIQSASLNGEPLERLEIGHDDIVSGGILRLTVSDEPNKTLK